MPIKCKDIKGFLVDDDPDYSPANKMGFRMAINRAGQVSIGLNREKLAKAIHDKWNADHKEFPFENVHPNIKNRCYGYADAIIANEHELLEICPADKKGR